MIEINRNPPRKQLLLFAAIWLPAFCLLLGGLLYRRFGFDPAVTVWAAGAVLSVISLASTKVARYVYLALVYATFPIGWVVSHVILAVLFYLILTPIGLALRLVGRDPLKKGFDSTVASYWQAREPAAESERYFRLY